MTTNFYWEHTEHPPAQHFMREVVDDGLRIRSVLATVTHANALKTSYIIYTGEPEVHSLKGVSLDEAKTLVAVSARMTSNP